MPVTAQEIESYKGDAALAAGPNDSGGNPQDYLREMDSAYDRLDQVAWMNMQQNREKYLQKVQDRNKTYDLISSDQLQINGALDADRDQLVKKRDEIKKFVLSKHGDVTTNTEDWIELNSKLADFKSTNTMAKSRFDTFNKGMADASNEVDPVKADAIKNWYNNEATTKDINKPLNPYQQTLDWNHDIVDMAMPQKQTDNGADANAPFNRVMNTRTQVQDAYKQYATAYIAGDAKHVALNVQTYLDNIFGKTGLVSPDSVVDHINNEVNPVLLNIAKKEGYDVTHPETLPEWLRPMQTAIDPTGQVITKGDNNLQKWFKLQLYNQYKNENVSAYDPNLEKLALAQSQIRQNNAQAGEAGMLGKAAMTKAQADMIRAKAYSDHYENADATKNAKNTADISTVYNTLVDKISKTTMAGITDKTGKQIDKFNVINTSELPAGYQNINGVVDNGQGKFVAGKLKPFTVNGKPYWRVNYYDPSTGAHLDLTDNSTSNTLRQSYTETVNAAISAGKIKSAAEYPYQTYITDALKSKRIGLEFQGKNGTANIYSLGQSIRAINDQITSKGDQPVYINDGKQAEGDDDQ